MKISRRALVLLMFMPHPSTFQAYHHSSYRGCWRILYLLLLPKPAQDMSDFQKLAPDLLMKKLSKINMNSGPLKHQGIGDLSYPFEPKFPPSIF